MRIIESFYDVKSNAIFEKKFYNVCGRRTGLKPSRLEAFKPSKTPQFNNLGVFRKSHWSLSLISITLKIHIWQDLGCIIQ